MKVAVIQCLYKGDNPTHFLDSIRSIDSQVFEFGSVSIMKYIHVDGPISIELEKIIEKSDFYKVIRSKESIGLAEGLNKLLDCLEDESYVFRMDSDDICRSDRFAKQIEFMESKPYLDFSGGSISEFENEVSNVTAIREYPTTKSDIDRYMYKASPFAHVTICFRRSSLFKIGRYPTQYPFNEDIALWNQSAKNDCLYENINDILCNVRMDSAYSRRTINKARYEFLVYFDIAIKRGKLPLYALVRFVFRMMPTFVVEWIYKSRLRKWFL